MSHVWCCLKSSNVGLQRVKKSIQTLKPQIHLKFYFRMPLLYIITFKKISCDFQVQIGRCKIFMKENLEQNWYRFLFQLYLLPMTIQMQETQVRYLLSSFTGLKLHTFILLYRKYFFRNIPPPLWLPVLFAYFCMYVSTVTLLAEIRKLMSRCHGICLSIKIFILHLFNILRALISSFHNIKRSIWLVFT